MHTLAIESGNMIRIAQSKIAEIPVFIEYLDKFLVFELKLTAEKIVEITVITTIILERIL